MNILGLTGGIGSGKSVVAELFRLMGVPVYDSDARSKMLCNTDEELMSKLKDLVGSDCYTDGRLNNQVLASRIFGDAALLQAVNQLIHPAVVLDFIKWVEANKNHSMVLMETAILFEAGLEKLFNQVICVTAPESLRFERVSKRTGMRSEAIRDRFKNQMSEEDKKLRSDWNLINDEVQPILPQVLKIIQTLSNK